MKIVAKYFNENPQVDAIYGICNLIDEEDMVINIWEPAEFDLKNLIRSGISTIPQQTVFFRKNILDEIGYLEPSLRHAMDYEYWIRIGQRFNFKKIPYLLANFRIQAKSKTSLEPNIQWKESCQIRAKYSNENKLQWAANYYIYKIKRIWPKFIKPLIFAKSTKERLNILRPVSDLIKSSFCATKQKFK
jgi:hypothetical protein